MIAEWAGRSIRDELIPGMDNMSALSWLIVGHARRGPSARIQVEMYQRVGRNAFGPPFLFTTLSQYL